MSKDNERSKGFDSLRQRLQDAEQNAMERDWNVPSDSVWKNIQSALPGRRRNWLAILPWLLFLGALAWGWNIKDQKRDLEEDFERYLGIYQEAEDSLQMALKDCQQNFLSDQQNHLVSTTSNNQNQIMGETDNRGRTHSPKTDNRSPIFNNLYSGIASRTFPSFEHTIPRSSLNIDIPAMNQWMAQRLIYSSKGQESDSDNSGLSALPAHHLRPFWISRIVNVGTSQFIFEESLLEKDPQESSKWSARAYVGYGILSPLVKGIDLPTSEALGLQINNGISFGVEALVRRKINDNWAVSTGMQYQDIQAMTGYQVDLTYDPTQEIKNDNGNFHIDFEHSIPSAAGKIDLNFGLLRLANDQIQTGETLPFRFQSNQHFHSLGVPIWVHYNFLPEKKFSLELATGYRLDYLLYQKTYIENFEVGHSQLHNRYAFMESSRSQYEAFTSQLLFGLEMGQVISNNFSLQARLRSAIPMNPIYNSAGTQSRFFNYDFSLGVAYNW